MPKIAAAFIVMAIVIAAVLIARSQTGAERPERTAEFVSKQLAKAPRGSLTPEAVMAIAPRAANGRAMGIESRMSPSLREFASARTYQALFDRLSRSTNRTPEEDWILRTIMVECTSRAQVKKTIPRFAEPFEEKRRRFVSALDANDPDRDKRLAAFDLAWGDRCQGLDDAAMYSREKWDALAQSAITAGDPKARAQALVGAITMQQLTPEGRKGAAASISEAQLQTLKDAFTSQDPYAIHEVGPLFYTRFQNMTLLDADGRMLDMDAFGRAANLLSCDLGYPCEREFMAPACAALDRCGAANYREYTMYYENSPYFSQLASQYEAGLRRAVFANDWSAFRFNPAPSPLTAAFGR